VVSVSLLMIHYDVPKSALPKVLPLSQSFFASLKLGFFGLLSFIANLRLSSLVIRLIYLKRHFEKRPVVTTTVVLCVFAVASSGNRLTAC